MLSNIIRKFVDREIMPVRSKLDDDHNHLIVNSIFRRLQKLGLDAGVGLVEQIDESGNKPSLVASMLLIEELAQADVGIGIVSSINGWALLPAVYANNHEVISLYKQMLGLDLPVFSCFAMTESDSGCDIENLPALHGKTIKTKAVPEGDSWLINGAKVLASNSDISSLYCIVCQTDPLKGEEGIALIYVPRDTPGLSFGPFESKAGLHVDRNASIYLEDVKVPKSYRCSNDGTDASLLQINLAIGRLATAAAAVGGAKGACSEVLKYTGTRIVDGKPIRNHSINAGIIADMITGIETARSYYLQVAYVLSNIQDYTSLDTTKMLALASICKNNATEMAIRVTNAAMELMGSYGYLRGYHLEKYWRDVKELQLWLGGGQLGRLDIVRGYYPFDL